jgi:hypothetical protein
MSQENYPQPSAPPERFVIDTPGIYNIMSTAYHADPCPTPSLSSSVARVLLDRSPRHAWMQHPRLNPAFVPEQRREFDLGSAAHAHLFGDDAAYELVDAENYRTRAAQEARDAIYAAGKTPLLPHQAVTVDAMVRAARAQLDRHSEAPEAFREDMGTPEQTVAWLDGGIWCRARIDWLPLGGNVVYDYKTTGGSAHPDEWGRRLFDGGYDIQAAFYLRGLRAVEGRECHFRFVVQEVEPPYALSVIAITPASLAMAERKVVEAIAWWRWCLDKGVWPGYPGRVAYVETPPWVEKRWLEHEDRVAVGAEAGEDLRRLMLDWQSPLPDGDRPAGAAAA